METSEIIKKGRDKLKKCSKGRWFANDEFFQGHSFIFFEDTPSSRPIAEVAAGWVARDEKTGEGFDADHAGFIVFSRNNMATILDTLERYETALKKIRDCDWVISLPDRMDAVRDIAKEALNPKDTK